MDSHGQENSFRIAHQNNRYRNSIEFPIFRENEEFVGPEKSTKIRFPSFESTVDSGFYRFLSQPDSDTKLDSETGFFNDFVFDLEADAKVLLNNQRIFSDFERKVYYNLVNNRIKTTYLQDRNTSIIKYKIKKARRKMAYKIRYKVRQDLAIKRLRNKGKFIKSKKMDLRTAANIIMIGWVIRKRKERSTKFENIPAFECLIALILHV